MIEFTELNISCDNKYLVIGVRIKCCEKYENVYLDSITIDNQDTFAGNNGSSKPLYYIEFEDDKKYFRVKLDSYVLNTCLKNLFIVKATTRGGDDLETPCNCDIRYTVGAVANMYPIYQKSMHYIREIERSCSIPVGFIDYTLKLEALELALKTCNYTLAAKYYRMFIGGCKKHHHTESRGGCGCGR